MSHDVFISYSSIDITTATALCHCLEENKIRCWMAPRDIPGGAEYGDVINEAIKSTKVFVLVYSDNSARSQWVKAETNLALANGKVIIPFRIDDSSLSGSMQLYLNDKHWIDAFPDPEVHFNVVVASVRGILNETVLSNVLDSSCPPLQKPKKWMRFLAIIASSVFGLWGGLISCGLFLCLLIPKLRTSPLFVNGYQLTAMCLAPLLFLAGVVLSEEHPWCFLKEWTSKGFWKKLVTLCGARRLICGSLRLIVAWVFVFWGGIFCCSPVFFLCKRFSAEGMLSGRAILSILLLGVVCVCSFGLPMFKTGWALLDRDYTKFRFTPRRLYKWICLILLPTMLCVAFFAVFSLENEWKEKTPVQTQEDSITRRVIQMFKESRWDEGMQLSQEANRHDPDLQFYLGLCYERGFAVSNDYAEALHWYRLSADNGNARAQCNLGLMYEKGLGVAQDFKKAFEWYQKASESGNPNAKAFLGDLYEHGKGVDQDVKKAEKLYRGALIASGTLSGAMNANDMTAALEADQSFAGMALKRMNLSFPSRSDCQANPNEAFAALIKISQKIREMLQKQGIVADQGTTYDLTADAFRFLGPGDDLEVALDTCVPGSVIMLREGVYNLDKTLYIEKPVKIFGSGTDKTCIVGGQFCIGVKGFRVSNMTFEKGKDKYGIWCKKDSEGCVSECNFTDCGIRFADSSCAVLAGVNVNSAEWGVSIGKDASVVYLGGTINKCADHCIIAFDNATIWAVGLTLSECGDNAVQLNSHGGRLFMGTCGISNGERHGIHLSKGTFASLSGVSIVKCAEEAIDARGECVHRQLKVDKLPIKVGGSGRNVCAEEDFVVPDFYFGRFTKRNIDGNAD